MHYDVAYKVFRFIGRDRCQRDRIRQKAVSLLVRQSRYRIPYDDRRLQRKYEREAAGWEANDFVKHAKSLYSQGEGLYRAIKFAARDPKPWTRQCPVSAEKGRICNQGNKEVSRGRGLTCSMAVVLAYQVAELHIDEKVHSSGSEEWPSDKYSVHERDVPGTVGTTDCRIPTRFAEYIESLQRTDSSKQSSIRLTWDDDEKLCPSYTFWKDKDVSPNEYKHSSYAVDCKSIGAEGMFSYMTECVNSWQYLGELTLEFDRKLDGMEYLNIPR
jgi:hypothetical protein